MVRKNEKDKRGNTIIPCIIPSGRRCNWRDQHDSAGPIKPRTGDKFFCLLHFRIRHFMSSGINNASRGFPLAIQRLGFLAIRALCIIHFFFSLYCTTLRITVQVTVFAWRARLRLSREAFSFVPKDPAYIFLRTFDRENNERCCAYRCLDDKR